MGLQNKECCQRPRQRAHRVLSGAHRIRWDCIWHVLHGFGAKCEAGIMILRNALYTMTIEAWEAKRDGLVALVEDLTLREVITPALRRKLYDII